MFLLLTLLITIFTVDIKRYPEDRFRIAREVCTTVMDVLEQMDATDRQRSGALFLEHVSL